MDKNEREGRAAKSVGTVGTIAMFAALSVATVAVATSGSTGYGSCYGDCTPGVWDCIGAGTTQCDCPFSYNMLSWYCHSH